MNIAKYAEARARTPLAREGTPPRGGELEIQARFYAGEFGLAWTGTDGERVEALHLGRWNREPGPDFVGALLRIDGRETRGDIELDPEDICWERHGHALNPAFDNVRLHVFLRAGRSRFFTRTAQNQSVVQVRLPWESRRPARGRPDESRPPDPAAAAGAVRLAAHFRLARKRERWLRAEALHGRNEALFQALATGLGYKNNPVPFLLVAQRVGLARARGRGGEALLFGVAGFLDAVQFDAGRPDARTYLRGLWDQWWAVRGAEERLVLPAGSWNFAGVRPQNHPHRRLAALAAVAEKFEEFENAVTSGSVENFSRVLGGLSHPYWNRHASLAAPLSRPCALVGAQRISDLAANILAPAAHPHAGPGLLESFPVATPSSKARKAVKWLGLPDAHPLLSNAFGQQGLIQIFDDFFPTPAAGVVSECGF